MGLIYHAALENSQIICFVDSRPWNVPFPIILSVSLREHNAVDDF